ncbi:MAG: glycosyltransferase family 4 protein [Candidatus Bathyarchaeia archaeon]
MEKCSPNLRKALNINSSLQATEAKTHSIIENFNVFEDFICQANHYLFTGKFDSAAAFGQIAAEYGCRNHPGLFVSSCLENVLMQIGQIAIPNFYISPRKNASNKSLKHVLHILTQAHSVGGHTRMAWRWIERDSKRVHSVVLTRQGNLKIPSSLVNAVFASGGQVYHIDRRFGGLVARAKKLGQLASRADLIVLHIHPYDVVPIIGLSCKQNIPPVIFVNHADHLFWQGISVSDVVTHIRDSGFRLSLERRKIESKRCLILPIPISRIKRRLSRPEAKRKLGFSEDKVVLLSIASAYKYKGSNTITFLEALLPVIKACDKVVLLIVGANENDLKACPDSAISHRIHFYGRREDTILFYQAADVYLDSFPFASITSLLEAGIFGTPLVSYRSHPEFAEVLCADDPGLKESLFCPRDIKSYRDIIINLIQDAELRQRLGEQTKEEILEVHEAQWFESLETLYAHAFSLPPVENLKRRLDQMHEGKLDLLLASMQKEWGSVCSREAMLRAHYRLFPLSLRFKFRNEIKNKHKDFPLNFIFSEWLCTWLRKFISRILSLCNTRKGI